MECPSCKGTLVGRARATMGGGEFGTQYDRAIPELRAKVPADLAWNLAGAGGQGHA